MSITIVTILHTQFPPRRHSRRNERSFGRMGRFAPHQLANHDSDPNGNMTRIPGFDLTFDAWNRLVCVASPDGTPAATYTYDALNRRITKTTPAETRHFYYNRNWQCLTEYANSSVTPDTTYVWGLRYVDDLLCRTQNSQTLYPLTDPNWNVVALVDSTGTLVERYTYNAFGKLHIYDGNFTPRSFSNYAWTRTFTGQVLDAETGLMLYRNRFYSPTSGRFLTRDPIGYKDDKNTLYRYVFNASSGMTDSWGLGCMVVYECTLAGTIQPRNIKYCQYSCTVKNHHNTAGGVHDCSDLPTSRAKGKVVSYADEAPKGFWGWRYKDCEETKSFSEPYYLGNEEDILIVV
ncbi:MAG: RHS repeat-associated core domain-containing protein [Planctomycetia bacterium]|nr:RHS repeat-associated core domain-containing protein [Planctomycetia bacterium]